MATQSAELTPDSFMQSQGAQVKDLTPDDFMQQQQAKPAPEVTSAIDAAIKTVPQPKPPQMQTMPLMERQPGTSYQAMDPKADARYQQQEAQKFTEEIGSAVPDAAVPALQAANKYAVEPFEKASAAGSKAGSELAEGTAQVDLSQPSGPAYPPPRVRTIEQARKESPIETGVLRAAGGVVGGTVADPRQWPLLFTGSAELKPLFSRLMSGGFGVQMGAGAAQDIGDIAQHWDEYTPDQRAEKIASSGLTTAFAALAAAHAAHTGSEPGHEASKEPPVAEQPRQVAPPVTGEPVAQPSGAVEKPVQASENLNPDTFMQEEANAVRPSNAQVQAPSTPVVERGEGDRPQAGAGDNGVGKESSGERQAGVPAGAEAQRPVPKVAKTRLQNAKDIDRVGSGKVAATELTEGYEPKVERGSKPRYQIAQLEDGRRVAYNPAKTNEQTVKEHAGKNELYKLTGDAPPVGRRSAVAQDLRPERSEEQIPVEGSVQREPASGMSDRKAAAVTDRASDVILARHGETALDQKGAKDTVAGWTAEPLDERGKKSAAAMAEELKPEPVSHIVTSDLERAKQTANIVGDKLGVPVTEDSRLRPQHTPETEGKQMGEAKPIHDYYVEHPDERPNGGETYNETLARQRAAISDAKAGSKNGEKPVVLTHSRNLESELNDKLEPGETSLDSKAKRDKDNIYGKRESELDSGNETKGRREGAQPVDSGKTSQDIGTGQKNGARKILTHSSGAREVSGIEAQQLAGKQNSERELLEREHRDRNEAGAQGGHGKGIGPQAASVGSRTPQERQRAGQSTGESGVNEPLRPLEDAHQGQTEARTGSDVVSSVQRMPELSQVGQETQGPRPVRELHGTEEVSREDLIGKPTAKPRTPGEPLEHGFDFRPAEDKGQQARDAVQKTQGALPRGERRKIERSPEEQATQKYFAQARKELGEEATSDQVMARVEELKKAQADSAATKEPWQMTQLQASNKNATEIFPLVGKVEVKNGKPVYTYSTTLKWGDGQRTFEIQPRGPLNGFQQASRLHEKVIEAAVAEGKPVPPEVLKDYPDLVTPYRIDSGRDKILESEIKHLKDQAAEVSKQVSKQGYYDPASKPLAEKYNQLLNQVREREDELARLKGEPTRSEKRDLQQKEAEKPFAERPQEPLTYGDARQSQHWQVAEPDYIAKRFEDKIKSYERAVAESRGEVASSKAGSKKHADAEMNLKYRKDMLERYKAKDPRLAQSFKTEYTELIKKAVSQGKPVPQSVIDQRPEFKLAQDARERYEKGRHTSFANKSAAINDTMQKEEGFKVKRQDGKPITDAQMKEISDGVNDIVKVLGESLRDAMRGTDLTIAHTSGKNPFLTVAGGLYHPVDRTISVGINDVLGRPVKAQAHEMGHWFDYESGRAIGVKNRIYTKGGKGHETQYLSESDSAKQLYDLARRTMTDTREVQRMLKVVKLSDLPEGERAEVERVKVVLGPYWRESREVFARMFEQYIADELGRSSPAAEDIGSYYKHPGWWSKEAWEKLKPMMAEEIKKRSEALKERYAPTEQAAPAPAPPQTAGDKSNPEFGQAKRELYPDKKELSDAEVGKVIDRAAEIAKEAKKPEVSEWHDLNQKIVWRGKTMTRSEAIAKEPNASDDILAARPAESYAPKPVRPSPKASAEPKSDSLETRALKEGAQPVKPSEPVPREGKNFEGRYVEAALATAQQEWEKASERYAKHTISWNKITDSRLEDKDGVQVNLHDPSGKYVASLNVHKTQNGFEILAKGALKEPGGKYGGNEVWQKLTETGSLSEAKKVAEARLRSGQVYSATDPWYGAGYSKSPDIPFGKVRPYSTIDPADTRPAAFPKDKLLVKVPDDGTFVVPNNPASIAKAIKATEGFVPEKTPSSFAARISKSPSDFNTEKYIVGLEKEVTALEDQIKNANTLQKPHFEEELKAARENLADAKKQTPETLSKRVVPGARSAATGNETGTTSIQDLTDSIRRQVPDKRPLKDRLNRGAQIGEQMESAKDSVSRTYARIKGAASALWDAVSRPAPYTEYEDATGKWQGADQINAHDLMGFTEAIKKAVPDKLHREAISNWIEAGGDDKILRERAAKSQAAYKKGYEQALKLTDAEKTIARNVMNRNDATLEEAQKAGILQQGVENYVRHVYADDPKMQAKVNAEMNFNSLKTKPSFTKERKIPTYFDAEQLGFTPKDKDVGYLTAIHERSFREALAARAYIRSLMEGKAEDGRPLVQTAWSSAKEIEAKDGEGSAAYLVKPNIKAEEEYADYRRIDHPALRGWRWAGKTDSGEPIFVQGDALVHPEIYAKLRNNLGRSAIRSYEMTVAGRTFHPGAAVLNVSAQVKHAILSFSGFHQTTLGMHALEHRTLPAGIPELDLGDAKQRSLVEHGLMVAQYDAEEAFGEGVASGGIVTKVPGIGPLYGHYVNYLFHDYLPRVKMAVARNALDRNFERYGDKLKAGKITEDQIYRITSEQANAAFGGLNYRMLGRNKTMQDVLRLGLMAPDFFEARARYTGQAAKPYGREQTVALLGGAVVLYTLGRLLNQALDDDPHWDKPFAIVHKGREYAMRTIQQDIFNALTDPAKYFMARVSPLVSTSIHLGEGRNQFGRKQTLGQAAKEAAKSEVPIPLQPWVRKSHDTNAQKAIESIGKMVGVNVKKAEHHHRHGRVRLH